MRKTIPDRAVRSLEVFESSCFPPLQSRVSDWREMQTSLCLSWRRGGGWEGWLGLLYRFAAIAGWPDRAPVRSLHCKATRLLHGCQELLMELLVWLVRRDVDPVEAEEIQIQQNFVTLKSLHCVFTWLKGTVSGSICLEYHKEIKENWNSSFITRAVFEKSSLVGWHEFG